MEVSKILNISFAIYSLIIYCVDTGSDVSVGLDLVWRCHILYASSVFAFVLMPSFVYGGYVAFLERRNKEKIPILKAFLAPLWYIPYSLYKLYLAILKCHESAPSEYDTTDDKSLGFFLFVCLFLLTRFLLKEIGYP